MKQHPSDYFEGILQIRDPTDELLDWIRKRIQTQERARIAKEKKVTNGVDFYISSQHYLQNLGRQLKDKFGGILKVSKRLHTMDKMTSRHVYRVTVLFQPLPFKRGDMLMLQGEQVEILRVSKKVQIKNLRTGEKSEISIDKLIRAKQ